MRWRAMLYLSISIHSNTKQKNKKNLCKNIIFASCLDCVSSAPTNFSEFHLSYFILKGWFIFLCLLLMYNIKTQMCVLGIYFWCSFIMLTYSFFFFCWFFKWKFFTMSLYLPLWHTTTNEWMYLNEICIFTVGYFFTHKTRFYHEMYTHLMTMRINCHFVKILIIFMREWLSLKIQKKFVNRFFFWCLVLREFCQKYSVELR